MEKEASVETQEAAVQAEPVAEFVREKLTPEQVRALPRKNRRLVSDIEVLRVAWIAHFRQLAVLFNLSPEVAESRWNEAIQKLKSFSDASQVLPRPQ